MFVFREKCWSAVESDEKEVADTCKEVLVLLREDSVLFYFILFIFFFS